MVAYVIAERLEQWDRNVFSSYGPLAAASITEFGGRYLAVSETTVTLEGTGDDPIAMAVIEFPSVEQAKAWYCSDQYQRAASIRRSGARNRFVVIGAITSPESGGDNTTPSKRL